jgi:very-short-patch-repair endonuclease
MAAGQRGLFSVAQAKEIGVSNAQLSRGYAAGQFRRVRRGVYAINGTLSPAWEQIVGAALAAGPNAVISHASAAAVHRFPYGISGTVELTVPGRGHSRPPGVVVHKSRDLTEMDVVRRGGLLVTSPCRTLVDLAGRLSPAVLEKLLDEGLIERRWALSEVQKCLSRARTNFSGRAHIERLLRLRWDDHSADSLLEARTLRTLSPLKPFEVHFVVEIGPTIYVIDVAWPDHKVGAEVIGWAHRRTSRSAFDRERRKLNALAAAGWKVAHLTAAMPPAEIVYSVRALLLGAAPGGLDAGKRH